MRGCSVVRYERGWPRSCGRAGVIERDGRWYCRQHDPVAKQQRSEARRAAWRPKYEHKEAIREADAAIKSAADALIEAVLAADYLPIDVLECRIALQRARDKRATLDVPQEPTP